ncbi:MAG: hypothetical protein H0T41_02070 [Rhodobacteraceae bacterium]|nr:hypothetical protein [Paracoccaceae bacterium]
MVEAVTDGAVGYEVAVATQVFLRFGLEATLAENMAIGAIFILVSLL